MSRRRCPLCDGLTDEVVCPRDRMATLLASAPPSQAPLPQPGMIVAGRYELEGLIGRGGHGQIFAARHLGTGQRVALKILLPPADADEDFAIKRFFLEARATSGLTHPNTVRVFDFGQEDNGLVFLALELLSGMTLRQELKVRKAEGRVFTEKEAIDIAVAITRSLAEAHAARLVHRDLKPDNVFLHRVAGDEPVVKVLDFGIAKLGGSRHTLSTPTSVPGTPAYMSPEQALTGDVDGRSDLYSLGVILFQLVSGELPFHGPSDPQTLYMHAYQPPPDLRTVARTPLSEAFVRVVARALEKDRGRRFADARELREALLAARDGDDRTLPPAAPMLARASRDVDDRTLPPAAPMAPALADAAGATPLTTARVPLEASNAKSELKVGIAAVAVLALGVIAVIVLGWLNRSEAPRTEALPSDGVAAVRVSVDAGAASADASAGVAIDAGAAMPDAEVAMADARAMADAGAVIPDAGVRRPAPKVPATKRSEPKDDVLEKRLEDLVPGGK